MRRVFYYVFMLCLFCLGCKQKKNELGCDKLVKIEITDSCFKKILTDYIKAFPFKGKGVYLATIISSDDSVKYYVTTAFSEQDIKILLKQPAYYFYDTISQRIVIISTKFEKYLKPIYEKYDCDTLLSKYFDSQTTGGWKEVYLIEFAKSQDTITRKVVQFDPF